MYSKKVIGDDYEYKGCDLVTLDAKDDPAYVAARAGGTGNFSIFNWDIPAGSYTEDYAYDHPAIITVELVEGNGRLIADVYYIQYLNGVKNQHSTDNIPVLGYTVKRAGLAHTIRSSGELIVNEKPTVLRIRILESSGAEEAITGLNSLKITLKYSYYVKKPSRIEPAPPNRFA